jgi:beta-lactamase regulating signal transducer with metallopeptidase domain
VQSLVQLGISNAAVAGALALVAFMVGRLVKRPALAHGLWLLVLLKLITPPLWHVPIDWPRAEIVQAPIELPIEPVQPPQTEALDSELPPVEPLPLDVAIADPDPLTIPPPESDAGIVVPELSFEETTSVRWPPWPVMVGSVWLGGTALYLAIAGLRLRRFRRLMRHAAIASDDLREKARQMAGKFHVGAVPEVWMIPGPVSPMLWAFLGRARILLPSQLWNKLTAEQQATLLAHELAHLRRRDHWTRRLELIVTALYWWNPVVWLARREISVAEEQCCDAWVVWLLPETARDYALALMETVDFLSETRPALPPAASGVGHVRHLRRRLAMIMRGSTPRALSSAGLIALLTLAVLTLPFVPTLAQSEPLPDEPVEVLIPALAEDELPVKKPMVAKVAGELLEAQLPQQDVEDAKDTVQLMQAQIEIKTAELKESMLRVKQAQARLDRMEKLAASGTISNEEVAKARDELGIASVQVELKQAQVHEAQIKKEVAVRRIERRAAPKKEVLKPAPAKQPLKEKLEQDDKAAALEKAKRFHELSDQRAKEVEQALTQANAQRARAEQAHEEAEKMRRMLMEERAKTEAAVIQAHAEAARMRDAVMKERTQLEAAAKQAHAEGARMRDAVNAERARMEAEAKKLADFKNAYTAEIVKGQADGGRLQAVEKKLDTLSREMEALRKDLKALLDQRK